MNSFHSSTLLFLFSFNMCLAQVPDSSSTEATRILDEKQVSTASYSQIDAYACSLSGKYKSIPKLASAIAKPYTTDSAKVRAIFSWICNNIAYDCAEYHSKNRKLEGASFPRNASKELRAAKHEEVYYKYASKVLRKRKGICEGYATLFYELCRMNNIKCEIVIGKVKKEKNGKTRYFGHAWNKVYINEQWYYLDATWAAGYCDEKVKKYFKDLSEKYYLTPTDAPYESHIENEKQTKKRNELVGNW